MRNEEELKRLRDRWYLFNEFMNKTYKSENLYNSLIKTIDNAFEKGQIKILRSINKDIDRDIKVMPLIHSIQLRKILFNELNEGVANVEEYYEKELIKILNKRKITSSNQFELVQCFLEGKIYFKNFEENKDVFKVLSNYYIKKNYNTY